MKSKNAYYQESVATFWKDLERNRFEKRMKEGGKLSPSLENPEVVSWRENATIISKLLNMAKLPKPNEVYIAFEYAAPVGGRVDCMFFGKGNNGKNILVLRNAFEKTRKQMKANALSINTLSDNFNFPMFAELTLKKT